jgi:hypothetical protein
VGQIVSSSSFVRLHAEPVGLVQSWVQLEGLFQPKMARKLRQINESLIGYEPEGRELESLRAHHSSQIVAADFPISELGPLGPTVKESPALFAARRRYTFVRLS